jgi:hypothetical protein
VATTAEIRTELDNLGCALSELRLYRRAGVVEAPLSARLDEYERRYRNMRARLRRRERAEGSDA